MHQGAGDERRFFRVVQVSFPIPQALSERVRWRGDIAQRWGVALNEVNQSVRNAIPVGRPKRRALLGNEEGFFVSEGRQR